MKEFSTKEKTPLNKSHDGSNEVIDREEHSHNGIYQISTEEAEFGCYYHSNDELCEGVWHMLKSIIRLAKLILECGIPKWYIGIELMMK